MNWFVILFLFLLFLIVFHITGTENFIFIVILAIILFSLRASGGKKKKKLSETLDFFTHKDTTPLEPYFDLIDSSRLEQEIDKILSAKNINDTQKAQIIASLLKSQLEAKASLFVQNPSAAITLAAYYKVYKKLEELEKESPKAQVYWCPMCFKLYEFKSENDVKKYKEQHGGLYCEHCHTKLVQIKAPFTFSFLSLISAPFDTALESLINATKRKSPGETGQR